jgi:tetratricopeptide (TPR) repeat protein
MNNNDSQLSNLLSRISAQVLRQRVVSIFAIAILAGCASVEQPRPVATVEVQSDVGFTIVEDAAVDDSIRLGYDDALRQLEQGSLEDGLAEMKSVSDAEPTLVTPLIDLGIAHHVMGNLQEAETHLLAAIELQPEHPVAHNELGIVYRKTGRFAEARNSYEAALAIYPGYHHARRNLAILCDLYLADLECALDNYEAYMTTVPGDKEAEMWIADLRYRLSQ